jgi:ATP-dependent Lon protease
MAVMPEADGKERPIPDVVGILPLRAAVVFPHAVVPLTAARPASIRLIEDAVQRGRLIGALMQRDATADAPTVEGLHTVGTLAVIHRVLHQSDGTLRLVVQGLSRFRLVELRETDPFLRARVEPIADMEPTGDVETEALVRSATSLFQKVVAMSPTLPDELASAVSSVQGPNAVADVVAASLPMPTLAFKQELLETVNVTERAPRRSKPCARRSRPPACRTSPGRRPCANSTA